MKKSTGSDTNPVGGSDGLKKTPPSKKPPTTIIGHVLENLGAHGIPNIKRAQNSYRRIFWLILFISGLTAFTVHCYLSITLFFQYDVTVNVDILSKPRLEFPAVTVCNLNPVKESVLANFTDLDDLLRPGSSMFGGVSPGIGAGPMSGPTMSPTTISPGTTPSTGRKKYQDWNNIDFGQMEDGHSLIEDLSQLIGEMDYEERFMTGHKLNDMLLSCSFAGYPCGPMNFTRFYNYLYGNCYTFNAGAVDVDLLAVSQAGPLFGLTMSLYIQQDEYISDIQEGAGVRVDIHSQKEMSFPEDNGVNVAPGAEAFISVAKTYISRKGTPYTNCTNNFSNSTIFAEYFPQVEYSILTCEKNCYYQLLLSRCGCADIRYRYDDSIAACNVTDPVQDRCQEDLETAWELGNIPCGCTFKCQEDVFDVTTSYSLWPNDKYKPEVQEGIRDISDSLRKSVNNDTSFVEKNVLKLNVFYTSLNFDYIYHTATYTQYELLSDLGGNVGLWIGISVLTIFELIELLYDVMVMCMFKAKNVARNKSGKKRVNASDAELDKIDGGVSGGGDLRSISSSGMDKKY